MNTKIWNNIPAKEVQIIPIPNKNTRDLTGLKFGRLKVLGYVGKTNDNHSAWKCLCDCGNYTIVGSNDLKRKNHPTISCGCRRREHMKELINNNIKDMTGTIFGKLKVIGQSNVQPGHGIWWDCQDEYGKIYSINGSDIRSGHNKGLLGQSYGEYLITQFLASQGYNFISEYRFNDCRDIYPLPFDFMVEKDNKIYLIEFDGPQHFDFTGTDWNTKEHLLLTQYHDNIKNQYCAQHGIPLLRIKYNENIEEKIKLFLGE